MKRWKSVTYASVYNHLYSHKYINKNDRVKSLNDVLGLKKKQDVRALYWVTKHLITIYNTQGIGKIISSEDYEKLERINKNAKIYINLRVRDIQHKMIEHVWRPDGKIASELKNEVGNFFY